MTGSTAARGKDLQQAAQLAAAEANANGGLHGRSIQIDLYDDQDQPDRAQELARQIAKSGAVAVLGQVASSAAASAGEVYRPKKSRRSRAQPPSRESQKATIGIFDCCAMPPDKGNIWPTMHVINTTPES